MKKIILIFIILINIGCNAQQKRKIQQKGFSVKDSSTVIIETSLGSITIELNDTEAPKHSENFRKLIKENFYNGTSFHRVIPGFMIQGGDPNSKTDDKSTHGIGGPGYTVEAEISASHDRGVIAAARQGDQVNPERRSSGSQFYITVTDAKFLDGQYTVFGKVLEGMEVADKIAAAKRDGQDNPNEKIEIIKMTIK